MRIVVLPGDDIGPEITAAARAVLDAAQARFALGLELAELPIGLASLAHAGTALPEAVLEEARRADGVILGPVSTYDYPPPEQGGVNPSATIRIALDLYANIRPARVRPGVPAKAKSMDLVIVRENTEGFYADRNMYSGSGELQPTEDVALAIRKISRRACRRIARTAFELASRRQKHVTMVHKANVLRVSDGLFAREVRAVGEEFQDVALDEMLVDAMAARLVRTPEAFDVVVTTNMYGDILSDLAAELAGGLGVAGALNAGDDHAVAQAIHGSAPDISGKGIANPTALILSTAMLLDWLGMRHGRDDLATAARGIELAVESTLVDPANHTPDLGGQATTAAFADAVAQAVTRGP